MRKTTLDYTDLTRGFLEGSFHSKRLDLVNSTFPVTLNACPATYIMMIFLQLAEVRGGRGGTT